jgi:hypothetical protein
LPVSRSQKLRFSSGPAPLVRDELGAAGRRGAAARLAGRRAALRFLVARLAAPRFLVARRFAGARRAVTLRPVAFLGLAAVRDRVAVVRWDVRRAAGLRAAVLRDVLRVVRLAGMVSPSLATWPNATNPVTPDQPAGGSLRFDQLLASNSRVSGVIEF